MVDKQHKPRVWFVAVDGSEHSKSAFELCLFEFYNNEDTMIVCSITDESKTYLPYEYRPDTIYSNYHTYLLSHIHSSKYMLLMDEKKPDLTVKDQILVEATRTHSNYIFIGFAGRKGASGELTMMGGAVRHAVINTKVPVFIIKKLRTRAKSSTKGLTFLVCLDGSAKAEKGLDLCKAIATNSHDQVLGCIVEAPDVERLQEVKEKFKSFQKQNKLKGEFFTLPNGKTHAAGIIEFANYSDNYTVDFVIFGNSGIRSELENQTMLGSTALNLLGGLHTNMILLP